MHTYFTLYKDKIWYLYKQTFDGKKRRIFLVWRYKTEAKMFNLSTREVSEIPEAAKLLDFKLYYKNVPDELKMATLQPPYYAKELVDKAIRERKKLLIYVYAPGCGSCKPSMQWIAKLAQQHNLYKQGGEWLPFRMDGSGVDTSKKIDDFDLKAVGTLGTQYFLLGATGVPILQKVTTTPQFFKVEGQSLKRWKNPTYQDLKDYLKN